MNRNKVAPEVSMINGVPHMLAYVNRAEKDMLRAAGGSGLSGPDGIPAYGFWDDFKSNLSKAASNFSRDIKAAPGNIARDLGNMAKQVNNDFGLVNNLAKNLTGNNRSSNDGPGFNISAPPEVGGYYDNFTPPPSTNTNTSTNTSTNSGSSGGSSGGSAPVDNSALVSALADRDAALAAQMSSLSDAFGFGTDDYYGGLRDSYTSENNQAFQTAYDDAMRGIYEGFKSSGLLTQGAVDQDKSKLGSANVSETSRLGTAAEEYAKANRTLVDEGRTGIEGDLNALAVDANTADAYRKQIEAINAFDVAGQASSFKTPTESSVADFFSDFSKRSYDPSYNVAPTAVATAGPSRVTQSVQNLGSNTQPSSMVGLRSPYKGRSTRVVT
tara:strand:+ start:46 stop:1197 length:1152 start_codon:yes stop_codon:yes gene_type:complete